MTIRTALRELIRRAWVLPVVAVIVGAGAFLIASRHHQRWTASVVAIHTPVKGHRGVKGLRQLQLVHLPASLAIEVDYSRPPAGVTLTPNSASSVQISTSGETEAVVRNTLAAYSRKLERRWDKQFTATRARALAAIQARSGSRRVTAAEIAQAIASVKAVTPTRLISKPAVTETSNPVRPAASAALGAACGLLLAVVLVLAVYAVRGQIWSVDELTPVGAAIVEVDSRNPADLHQLRIELEALGLASGRQTVLITAAGRRTGWPAIARGLADAFAEVSYDVVVIDLHGSAVGFPNSGVKEFLAGSESALQTRSVADHIRYLPAGILGADQRLTAEGVSALLAEASRHSRVTIVDCAGLDSPTTTLFAAATDMAVVTVRRGSSTSSAVIAAVARLRRTIASDPVLCFDHARYRRPPQTGAGHVPPEAAEAAAVAAGADR